MEHQENATVRCLCYRHMRDYRNSSRFMVQRVELYSILKEKCDWCGRFGFEYYVTEKAVRKGGIANG